MIVKYFQIADNAIEYNGDPNYETNKIICHRARALQDFSYALVKAEMVSDRSQKTSWTCPWVKIKCFENSHLNPLSLYPTKDSVFVQSLRPRPCLTEDLIARMIFECGNSVLKTHTTPKIDINLYTYLIILICYTRAVFAVFLESAPAVFVIITNVQYP